MQQRSGISHNNSFSPRHPGFCCERLIENRLETLPVFLSVNAGNQSLLSDGAQSKQMLCGGQPKRQFRHLSNDRKIRVRAITACFTASWHDSMRAVG